MTATRDRNHIAGKPITGANYVPSCGCDVPPWEICACSEKLPTTAPAVAATPKEA